MGKNDLAELALNKGIRPAATTVQQMVPREQDPQFFNDECCGVFNRVSAATSAEDDRALVQPCMSSTNWQKCKNECPIKPPNGSATNNGFESAIAESKPLVARSIGSFTGSTSAAVIPLTAGSGVVDGRAARVSALPTAGELFDIVLEILDCAAFEVLLPDRIAVVTPNGNLDETCLW